MSSLAEYLASYGTSIKYEDIPPQVVHKLKALLIDTLACGLAGYDSEPGKIARRVAGGVYQCEMPATILGSSHKSTPELATFANGVMIRYLDLNDGYDSGGDRGGGHPSDNFAPVLTCADAIHANGRDVIVASALAYEVFCRLSDKFTPAPKGFDQAITAVISGVMGVSQVFGLSHEQMVQAINLAIAPNISLGQTREGELSMWKGCAVANAARNAVFAALLAKEGMTGPSPIFEGRSGFFKVINGPFQLEEFGGNGRPFRIMDVIIKQYPCGMVAQTAIDAAINLRSKIASVDEITEISIGTFTSARNAMANSAEKWHPGTRESADHSLPYVVAVALMFGTVEKKHFDDEYLHNPALLDLIKKIEVAENEECNQLRPDSSPNRIDITTKNGEKFSEMIRYHRGHHQNTLSDAEVAQKFYSLTRDLLLPARSQELISLVWNLEQVKDTSRIMQLLII